jgi:hypothetical protein
MAGVFGAGAIAAWRMFRLSELASIGAGYAAEQTCACLFVSHRTPESCRTDLEPLARWLVSVRAGADEVTARAFGVATATARYEKNFGCTLRD